MKLITLITRNDGRCFYCTKHVDDSERQPHPDAPTRDHFIPLAKGGRRGASNQVLACHSCNKAKADFDIRTVAVLWSLIDPQSFAQLLSQLPRARL